MKLFLSEPAARADLRRLDGDAAMRILIALTRYSDTGEGDVKLLTERDGLYRLRVGTRPSLLRLSAWSQLLNSPLRPAIITS